MKPYYQDDLVTLFHGDCLEITEWLEADVLVTDPPYGMSYESGRVKDRPSQAIANDESVSVRNLVLELWGDKPAIAFGKWSVQRPANVRARLIWSKGDDPGMGDLNFPWGNSDEEIYVFGSGFVGKRGPNVITCQKPPVNNRPDHPTPKPIPLMERLIEKCPPGVIADPFAGSGSTLIAAVNQGRRAIGVELEERYCELIAKRLSSQTMTLDFGEGA
ncbi:DNA-methyltransferase [Mycobacteroides abscessus]|uniref:DNA-methyltransferase n=1 Tax=Mycobacteroides abscessus TaxID=36809 RepID=UPI000C25EEC0|nr:DNA methyltransferase [Mycobacteroides abscessus]PVB28692.1 site-specific DNA-methyltransferase [Mycobacteroides abscessus]